MRYPAADPAAVRGAGVRPERRRSWRGKARRDRQAAWHAEIGAQRRGCRPAGASNPAALVECQDARGDVAHGRELRELKADAGPDTVMRTSPTRSRSIRTWRRRMPPARHRPLCQRRHARCDRRHRGGFATRVHLQLCRAGNAHRYLSEARKDWKGAYTAAWQKVLEIDPKTPGGNDRLKDLRRHALGEEVPVGAAQEQPANTAGSPERGGRHSACHVQPTTSGMSSPYWCA